MSETITTPQKTPRRGLKKIGLALGLLLVLGAAVAAVHFFFREEQTAIASFPVQQGEFVIALKLKKGVLEAVKSEQINAPRVRGQLKIVELFPEGEVVDVGDLVIRFDQSEFQKRVTEAQQGLEAARAELEKELANQQVEIARQESDIENKASELRLSRLQVEKMKFESMIEKQEAELKARQTELALKQARKKLEAQKIVDGAELKKRNLDVAQKQRDLDKATRDFESLSVYAEKPGLVVYEKIWKGSRPEKIRVGDEPWGGATLITLPDLSRMRVKTFANEVDVDKLEVGQQVSIKLDALPEPTFHGSIASIAALGHEKEGEKNIKVFDVLIAIAEQDERLKPGMSATSRVIIETIPPRPGPAPSDSVRQPLAAESPADTAAAMPLYIPLDAVFEKDGATVVYKLDKGAPVKQEVELGKRNENYVIVEAGLGPDDRVALLDPTHLLDDLGGLAEEPRSAGRDLSAQ